jgi:hypothetical protein
MRYSTLLSLAALGLVACKQDPDPTDTDSPTDTGTPPSGPRVPVWLATGGGPPDSEMAFSAADVGDGTVVAVGAHGGLAEFVGPDGVPVTLEAVGEADMFVARFDAATGRALSAFGVGSEGFEVGWDVSGTGDGGLYAVGHYTDPITVGPTTAPVTLPAAGPMSVMLGSWDADDQLRFALAMGDTSGEFQMRVNATSDGGAMFSANGHAGTVVALGTPDETTPPNAGGDDILVGKVSSGGALEWVRTYGGPGDEWFGTPIETEDGYLLVGQFTGTTDFGGLERTASPSSVWGDGFVARFAWDGTGRWVTTFPSRACDVRRSALTDDGGVVVGGEFAGDVTFDAGGARETTFSERQPGDDYPGDAFLARLNLDDGSFSWAHHLGTNGPDSTEGIVALPGGGVTAFGQANIATADPQRLVRDWSDDAVTVGMGGWIASFDAAGEPGAFDAYDLTLVYQGALLPDGDLLVSGGFATGAVFGEGTGNELAPSSNAGAFDPFVLRLHP